MKSNWQTKTLGEICDILDSQRLPITKKDRIAGPYPYYGASGIIDKVASYLFDERLLLLGEDGAKWGAGENSAFIINGKAWVNNHVHILRVATNILDVWLMHYLNWIDLSPYISGVTVPKLTQKRMLEIPVPVPPLSEQKRIVGILDAVFGKIDTVQRKAERNLANAKELFQRVLDEEMTPKKGWETSELQNVVDKHCSLSYGIVQPGDEQENGVPVVRPVNLGPRSIGSTGLKRIASTISQSYRRTILTGEEILLCVRGETGIVSMATKELAGCNVTRGIVPILFNSNKINKKFGYYLMRSPSVYEQIKKKTTGTALKQINIGDLRKIPISYPEIKCQNEIINTLEKVVETSESIINNTQKNIEYSNELKQQILAKAFNGEL